MGLRDAIRKWIKAAPEEHEHFGHEIISPVEMADRPSPRWKNQFKEELQTWVINKGRVPYAEYAEYTRGARDYDVIVSKEEPENAQNGDLWLIPWEES